MEKWSYRYEANYHYDPAVKEHYLHLRCKPVSNNLQQVYGNHIKVGYSASLHESEALTYIRPESFREPDGITTYSVRINAPHCVVHVVSEGVVYNDVNALKKEALVPGFETFTEKTKPGAAIRAWFNNEVRPLLEAPVIPSEPAKKRGLKRTKWEITRLLMDCLYGYFSYESGATGVGTTAEQAFAKRKGVCQDYAHILITLCRMMRIPARYVAGFLEGEGATHAWVEIYDNGYWYGFDPTHNRTITDSYIKIAHGRDADACALERGTFIGYCEEEIDVSVRVAALSED